MPVCVCVRVLASRLVWTLFILFTIFHLLANHRAVSVVAMETLNQNRLHLLVSSYFVTGTIPSVAEVNAREPILSCNTFDNCRVLMA